MLVAVGRISAGNREMEIDRAVFTKEALEKCLTAREINLLDQHFSHAEVLSESVLASFLPHLENCQACAQQVSSLRSVNVRLAFEEDSLHTSTPPAADYQSLVKVLKSFDDQTSEIIH